MANKEKDKKDNKKAYRFHPIDKEIIRSLQGVHLPATPSQIANAIGVHPVTVKLHLKNLNKEGFIVLRTRGNRWYCRLNSNKKAFIE